ncbi:predicted protein [Arabidopsis lyrata subsp. lyrata]|uniref:Predicted protein n=1 Tax=Arabidopsis lyrata subsp. lyrata TaxID=81972 RepID=D7KSG2_ARALL|nr:predicted protein [Arabidopsis lyrata subsp. lyrata]
MALLGEMDQLGEVTQLNEMTELGIGVLSRHDESIGSSWRGIIVRRVIECRSGRSVVRWVDRQVKECRSVCQGVSFGGSIDRSKSVIRQVDRRVKECRSAWQGESFRRSILH